MSDWNAETLRLTLLPTLGHSFSVLPGPGCFKKLTGQEPDRLERDLRAGSLVEAGIVGDVWTTVLQQFARVDVTVGPLPAEMREDGLEELPSIGPFAPRCERLVDLGSSLFEIFHVEVVRIAFGVMLFSRAKGHSDGYLEIAKWIPAVKLDPNTSDFAYQINRPRTELIGGEQLRFNRLSKWSVVAIARTLLSFQPGVPGSLTSAGPPTLVSYACRAELDVNTDAERRTPLGSADLVPALRKLAGLAGEICERGDVP